MYLTKIAIKIGSETAKTSVEIEMIILNRTPTKTQSIFRESNPAGNDVKFTIRHMRTGITKMCQIPPSKMGARSEVDAIVSRKVKICVLILTPLFPK
jgi:hypothetical protein